MPDPTPTPQPTPAPAPKPRGYFNQGQLDDIATAEDVLSAARSHADDLATRDITTAYVTGFAAAIKEARDKTAETGQSTDASQAETLHATKAERTLVTTLQGIQSAAKQKHKMLAEDEDPATDFPTDGYLIGKRLNPGYSGLLQSAATLIGKAKTDDLPGYRTPESIAAVEAVLAKYKEENAAQADAEEGRGTDRIERDALIAKINTRRSAIQHAADALWPYTDDTSRPVRKSFQLPLSRPLGG